MRGGAPRARGHRPRARARRGVALATPKTRYAKSGDVNVAYQVLGDGPLDLVLVYGWLSHLDFQWTEPILTTFLRRLAGFSRLIMFDKRGTGLSDPIPGAPSFEERMDDIRAVMEAVGSERAALLGFSEGAAMSALYAASHPERVTGLILYEGFAGANADAAGVSAPEFAELLEMIRGTMDRWGEGETALWAAPSVAHLPLQQRFWGMFERISMSPGAARALWEAIQQVDVRDVLPTLTVPTLVLHHTDSAVPLAAGRLMADLVPGARLVELPGRDHIPGAGDPEAVAGEIEEFLTGARGVPTADRVLATVLFTDIVDSTRRAAELGDASWRQLLERHDALVRAQLARFRGNEVKQTGDGFLARFDGPARAIRCAQAIGEEAEELGITVRSGLHTGECEVIGDDIGGVAVHVAARVGARARAGEVLVSGTLRDLVMGSGITLADRGEHELKGVPGTWRLFAAQAGDEPAGSPDVKDLRLRDRAFAGAIRRAPGLARASSRAMRRRSA